MLRSDFLKLMLAPLILPAIKAFPKEEPNVHHYVMTTDGNGVFTYYVDGVAVMERPKVFGARFNSLEPTTWVTWG